MILNWGLTETQAAGILGNMKVESDFSPTNAQNSCGYPGRDNPEYIAKYNVKDKIGWGLVQRTYWSRKQWLLDYANSKGTSVGDMDTQLEYLFYELTHFYKSMWNAIHRSNDINTITVLFEKS